MGTIKCGDQVPTCQTITENEFETREHNGGALESAAMRHCHTRS
jgi:hypothetical protein